MRRIVTLLFVVTAAVAAAAVALAAPSPKAVRASIVAAALAQKSLHWTEHDVVGGGATIVSAADVDAVSGTQKVTVTVGKQTGTVHIVSISDTAYVKGDAFGLQANLGLTSGQATQYAGQWIAIPKGDKAYTPTASGLTVASIVHGMTPRGTLKAYNRTVHGTKLVVVEATSGSGKTKRLEGIAAHARSKLPIEADSIVPGRQLLTHLDFSKWNESVTVTAPATSVPIATVRAG